MVTFANRHHLFHNVQMNCHAEFLTNQVHDILQKIVVIGISKS